MLAKPILAAALASAFAATAEAPSSPIHRPAFDPLAFFTGETRGSGELKVMFGTAVPIRVESSGRPDGRGGLLLAQTIHEGTKPPRNRHWVFRPTGSPTRLTATLSDAAGPVSGTLAGSQLRLAYAMPGGMKAYHVLTLQPGGRSLINTMRVKRFGLTVARLDETIAKLD